MTENMTAQIVLRKEKKSLILEALELKQKLKGSVVWERVKCGKRCCRKCKNGTLHGPYPYLHYYHGGRVKRKYLRRALGDLVSRSVEELKEMLKEAEEILGQDKERKAAPVAPSPSSLAMTYKAAAKVHKNLRW
jgi:hypothetical protein